MPASRLPDSWKRLWGSVAFRLTLNYSLLAAGTTAFLLIFAYGKIVDLLQVQFARQVTLATHRLTVQHELHGLEGLRAEIEQLLSDQTDIDTEMYLLTRHDGVRLVGNLELLPITDAGAPFPAVDLLREAEGVPLLLNVLRNGTPVTGLLTLRDLADDSVLVVGRDIADMRDIQHLIGNAVIATTLVGLFLVLVGTTIFRRELRHRVEAIRDTALRVGTGELTRRIPDARDVDEFAQLRDDINHMLDRIENLMTGVRNVSDSIAHNLRTPLARVLGHLDAARRQRDEADAQADALDAASAELHDLIAVSEKLLLIAEAESGVRRQSFTPVALKTLAEDVFELYEPAAAESGIRMRCVAEEVDVDADADLLASALTNLIDNAFKYAGPGATIALQVTRHNGAVRLTVSDDGRGVPEEHLDKLGTRFHRVEPDVPGFGLGLASVRAVVLLHGGDIVFSNTHPGLRVDITLPGRNITER